MKIPKLIALAILILFSNMAFATTYLYTGQLYTSANAPYTTAMFISGSFETAAPLPANMALTGIGPAGTNLVTNWSFNDGVETFTNLNSGELFGQQANFQISTDANGQVNNSRIQLIDPPAPYTAAPPIAIKWLSIRGTDHFGLFDSTIHGECVTVSVATMKCTHTSTPTTSPKGLTNTSSGTWMIQQEHHLPIPSLSMWSIVMLIGLLGFIGIRRREELLPLNH